MKTIINNTLLFLILAFVLNGISTLRNENEEIKKLIEEKLTK